MNDGGPAFPVAPVGTGDPRDGVTTGGSGLSMRDYFAGQALAGMAASSLWEDSVDCDRPEFMAIVAQSAYAMADAMLKAREERKS